MGQVDSYRWLPRSLAGYYRGMDLPHQEPVPFTPLSKSLGNTRVTAITTGGVHLRSDRPFDIAREEREPTWGDPTYRILPADLAAEDIAVSHLHYNSHDASMDLDVVFPVPLLTRLAGEGVIGSVTPRHYSFMGFQLDATELLDRHLPEVVSLLKEDQSDAVVLTPA